MFFKPQLNVGNKNHYNHKLPIELLRLVWTVTRSEHLGRVGWISRKFVHVQNMQPIASPCSSTGSLPVEAIVLRESLQSVLIWLPHASPSSSDRSASSTTWNSQSRGVSHSWLGALNPVTNIFPLHTCAVSEPQTLMWKQSRLPTHL